MNHWEWRADIHQLKQLFSNTLPLYDRLTGELHTRFFIKDADLELALPGTAVRPAALTVFDGQQFLHQQPMMYGKWRRNGQAGTAQLVEGLAELLAPTTRRDDAALCLLSDTPILQSETARYFTLQRVHVDRLIGWSDADIAALLKTCRLRTTLLRYRLQELMQSDRINTADLRSIA